MKENYDFSKAKKNPYIDKIKKEVVNVGCLKLKIKESNSNKPE